jgi:hypothetical protein
MFTHRNLGKDAVSVVNTPKSPFIPQIAHSLNKPGPRYFESLFLGISSQNNLDFPAEFPLTVAATVGLSVRVRPHAVARQWQLLDGHSANQPKLPIVR